MVQMGDGIGVVAAALAVVLLPWLWAALAHLVWRPYAVARAFARQGVRGRPYRFFVGNTGEVRAMRAAASGLTLDRSSHDIVPRVMPHLRAWKSLYGKVFFWWSGSRPVLCVGNYDMVKRVLSDKAGLYRKPEPGPALVALMGRGLVLTEGEDWARHRSVVHPAFAMDKLKTMARAMEACAGEVVRSWEARAAEAAGGEATVEVGHQFKELTADVISHTAFGSSFRQGKEVFLAQRELQHIAFASFNKVRVPGMEYLPTKNNVRRWQLERKVRGTLMAIIDERLAAAKEARGYGTDLLGLMLEANAGFGGGQRVMNMDEIIDECKTFFFAGHDTTAHLLTWAMFLLGTHPEWQRRLREEVLRECGGAGTPLHGDALSKLKLVMMVLYETLRLYGAVNLTMRQATADVDLCGVKVPKGTLVSLPFAMLHRDEEVWGCDAGEFNPHRFLDGVGRAAAHPRALLSFSLGPRSCIGQDFAMLEAKITLALILQRFAFEVAPEYVHAPADFLTLQPRHGLPVVLKLLGP
ncbi:hypothetical protein SEVIR_1G265100v4 [Setaria viridis]|uniref:Cytochrome P450 n=1 Tax=Setaria viridis TaxID=4556 RepID=A0A4U6WG51_SETVI|nr:cytochrome P450 709B2-like [Setaria viridis]TKW40733.1 hypothetical protein SEVIR_1G265100v2 [Setaria viridis]